MVTFLELECKGSAHEKINLGFILKALENISGKKATYTVNGLRAGEKLHESMLDDTEAALAYEVKDTNLIHIRPQYGNKVMDESKYTKYTGPVYISSNHVSEDVDELVTLIKRGISEE